MTQGFGCQGFDEKAFDESREHFGQADSPAAHSVDFLLA